LTDIVWKEDNSIPPLGPKPLKAIARNCRYRVRDKEWKILTEKKLLRQNVRSGFVGVIEMVISDELRSVV